MPGYLTLRKHPCCHWQPVSCTTGMCFLQPAADNNSIYGATSALNSVNLMVDAVWRTLICFMFCLLILGLPDEARVVFFCTYLVLLFSLLLNEMPQHVLRKEMFFLFFFGFTVASLGILFFPQLWKKDCDYPEGQNEALKGLSNVRLGGCSSL